MKLHLHIPNYQEQPFRKRWLSNSADSVCVGSAIFRVCVIVWFFSGRPPGPEMEYCTDRESYSLASGLALGMVCLGVSAAFHFSCN